MMKMKRLFITLALVLSLAVCGCAATQSNGGIFQRGENVEETKIGPGLPGHGQTGDQPAPVGAGVLALAFFGAAYLIGKKSKENE